jgi:hypothetical protein
MNKEQAKQEKWRNKNWQLSKEIKEFIISFNWLWLRHYAKSRNIAGSIPDDVIGFSDWRNPSSRAMALGSTQPLTEMSTRNLSGVKRCPERKTENLTAICEPVV